MRFPLLLTAFFSLTAAFVPTSRSLISFQTSLASFFCRRDAISTVAALALVPLPSSADETSKGSTLVEFTVSNLDGGEASTSTDATFTIRLDSDWAPIGVEHLKKLVSEGFYTNTRFFRVIDNFVAQWGLSDDPKVASLAKQKIADDPNKVTNR